jgi:DNA (cytosine-5)-methyltransferase 1
MRHLDLFSGIGGFALAADRVFGETEHIFVENNKFRQQVLKKHWPNAQIYGDIRQFTANTEYERPHNSQNEQELEGKRSNKLRLEQPRSMGKINLLTGGFPCQPFSQAGLRAGMADDRYLWPEMFRVIQLAKPQWVIAENVRGLVTWNSGLVLEQVCADLESEGYQVQPFIIPAVAVNAPHRRDRVWFIAHTKPTRARSESGKTADERRVTSQDRRKGIRQTHGKVGTGRIESANSNAQNSIGERRRRGMESDRQILECEGSEIKDARPDWTRDWLEVATRLCRVDDGLPRRMDRNPRLKALGDAIVPLVAEQIMRAILRINGFIR